MAIKVAPFDRYQTLEVARALAESGRAGEVALYTGNDDAIVADLLVRLRPRPGPAARALRRRPPGPVGGLDTQGGGAARGREAALAGEGRPGASRACCASGPAAHRRQRGALRRPQRLRRLHRGHPRGAAPAGPPGRPLSASTRTRTCRRGRWRRSTASSRAYPHLRGRRLRRREPRPMAELSACAVRDLRRRACDAQERGVATRHLRPSAPPTPSCSRRPCDRRWRTASRVLVESTSNQVNPEGGYTGPDARRTSWPSCGIGRGGGGFSRRARPPGRRPPRPAPLAGAGPAASAMAKAREMVRQYVVAGYAKIHLDASMRLRRRPPGPPRALDPVARHRAGRRPLRRGGGPPSPSAPTAAPRPVYVIGTEVPVAGGEAGGDAGAHRDARGGRGARPLALPREAFARRGLEGPGSG